MNDKDIQLIRFILIFLLVCGSAILGLGIGVLLRAIILGA